jgi:hypothetical protein
MARIDWKHSQRYNADSLTKGILTAMKGWQSTYGDTLTYFRWDPAATVMDDVYDEAIGNGLIYTSQFQLPAQHVSHVEGGNENGEYGFYYNDDLDAQIAFDRFIQCGMSMVDIMTGNYLKDRVYYDRKIFRVTHLAVEGQIQERDIIIGMTATQMKPDELVNDVFFAEWSLGGANDVEGTE